MTTQTAPAYYVADLERLNKALAPWTITLENGWVGIDLNAPKVLTGPYAVLVSLGYLNGWIA